MRAHDADMIKLIADQQRYYCARAETYDDIGPIGGNIDNAVGGAPTFVFHLMTDYRPAEILAEVCRIGGFVAPAAVEGL